VLLPFMPLLLKMAAALSAKLANERRRMRQEP